MFSPNKMEKKIKIHSFSKAIQQFKGGVSILNVLFKSPTKDFYNLNKFAKYLLTRNPSCKIIVALFLTCNIDLD